MSDNPYRSLPDRAFWRRAVASVPRAQVDPVGLFDVRIDHETKVATAGSCFAQHIARHLQRSGFRHYVAEPGHPLYGQAIRDHLQRLWGMLAPVGIAGPTVITASDAA